MNTVAGAVAFCLFDGADNGGHNSNGFVEISEIFATYDTFFSETESF